MMAGDLQPIRVLMTADTIGGVWTYSIDLIAALVEYGVEVVLATMGEPLSHQQRKQVNAIPTLRVFESTFKLEWMREPWDDVSEAGKWLLELNGAAQPHVVHLNGYTHAALQWNAPVIVVGHSCVFSWWQAVHKSAPPAEWNTYYRNVSEGVHAADLVITPTGGFLRTLAANYRQPARSLVIPNGRATSLFAPAKKERFVFSAGRLWDEAKNSLAVDAIAGEIEWPVYLAGEDVHPAGGHVKAQNAMCLGRLPATEVADWLGRASIYVLPARYEPFGLSVLEAAYSGCALVLGDIETLREVWDDAALFVPPDDIGKLKAVVTALIRDEGLRSRMASSARKRAAQFSTDKMAKAYLKSYENVINLHSKKLTAAVTG